MLNALALACIALAPPAPAPAVGVAAAPGPAPTFVEPMSDAERAKAKKLLEAIVGSERGPYLGVLWYCADGTTQEPKMYACEPHGGGKQYGVYSFDLQKLWKLGIFAGTILTATPYEDLAAADYYRLRALVLESYLERALGGWTVRRLKDIRGFRQLEDEQESARLILLRLLQDREMLGSRRSLAMRLMRALPYGKQGSLADEMRALAAQLGDADMPGFGLLRFKIHAMPEPADIQAVEAYAATQSDERASLATKLADAMRAYYDPRGRMQRLGAVKQWIWDNVTKAKIDAYSSTDPNDTLALLRGGLELIGAAEKALRPAYDDRSGERDVLLLHVMQIVEELWIGVVAPATRVPMSRAAALSLLEGLFSASRSLGWLSSAEAESVAAWIAAAKSGEIGAYLQLVERLALPLEWARARLLRDLGVPLARYAAVEPQANRVVDDQLRSSIWLLVAVLVDRLSADAERLQGGGHRLLGVSGPTAGMHGLNAGFALGPLRILKAGEDPSSLERGQIALLSELPPELPPVAGIITVGAAASLSHVALLARNLGIPHAAISAETAAALMPLAGQEVVLGVSSARRVLCGKASALPATDLDKVKSPTLPDTAFLQIDASTLELASTALLPLDAVRPEDKGTRLGPKAAEVGHLRSLFKDRVSNAAVIPFGAFVAHVDRPGKGGEPSPLAKLRNAYGRAKGLAPAAAEALVLPELAAFREAIQKLPFPPGFDKNVQAALARLGPPGTFGVFVRSDTNVEDLKDFTGAGLNLTVPNRVRLASIMQAIRDVWASPFSERSYRWRQRILKTPEHVYPSVLLHRTIPSEKSGVLVTVDLETGAPGLTISVSEGVSAVVDGGSPETLVIEPTGKVRRLASNCTPTKKAIPPPPAEGVVVQPSANKEPLLTPKELEELRRLADEVQQKMPTSELPWDVEFGIVRGKVFLLQIRPLRTSRAAVTHPLLAALDRAAQPTATTTAVDLDAPLP